MSSAVGREWSPTEGEFPRLKYLYIDYCPLIRWNVDSSHFPVLEQLSLYNMDGLEVIPSVIGEIPTLNVIELDGCRVCAAVSAMEILVEQESLGNDALQLRVYFFDMKKLDNFRRRLERKGLTSQNLFVENARNYM